MGLQNQSATPGRTNILGAVNTLLMNVGEMPVDSLSNVQVQDARIAEATILELHKEGQTKGWSWNTEHDYPFQKDTATTEIVVPANVMRWVPNPYNYARRFELRGQKVYDRDTRSTKFDDTITEIRADVVWLLDWDSCPEPYNRYATMRAARVFSARTLGNDSLVRFSAADEQAALTELQRMELENNEYNLLTGGRGLSPFPTYQPGFGLLRNLQGGRVIG
jgi:hypothetical protein